MCPLRFKGLEAYAAEIFEFDYKLYYLNIIGSDSIARGIAAGILEKQNRDLEIQYTGNSYFNLVDPKDAASTYKMITNKLSDNAVSIQIIHSLFLPVEQRDGYDPLNHEAPHRRFYLLPGTHEQTTPTEIADIATAALWNHINTFNTPLLESFARPIARALYKNQRSRITPYLQTIKSPITSQALMEINCNTQELDQTVSELVRSNEITF